MPQQYISDTGYQGAPQDYFLSAIADHHPAEQQVHQRGMQAIDTLDARARLLKSLQEQKEWMQQGDLRNMEVLRKKAEATLGQQQAEAGLQTLPMETKNKMTGLQMQDTDYKRKQLDLSVAFLGENGQRLLEEVNAVQDPAEKNRIWQKFMSQAESTGVDVGSFRNWTPQAEQKMQIIIKNTVENPEFQRKVRMHRQTEGQDRREKNDLDAAIANQNEDLERWKTMYKGQNDIDVAKIAAGGGDAQEAKNWEKTDEGYKVLFKDGHVETIPDTTSATDKTRKMNENIRAARRAWRETPDNMKASFGYTHEEQAKYLGKIPDYMSFEEIYNDVKHGIISQKEAEEAIDAVKQKEKAKGKTK